MSQLSNVNKITEASQTELFGAELSRLSADITKLDRKVAAERFSISRVTISNYLNSKIRDNDLAASLIKFFKGRIKERNAVLA